MQEVDEYAVEVLDEGPVLDEMCSVTRELCSALLTLDDFDRRRGAQGQGGGSMPVFGLDYFRDLQRRIRTAPIQCWTVVPSAFFRGRRRRAMTEHMTPLEEVTLRLHQRVPRLAELMELGRGHLVLAGSAVVGAILDDMRHLETDFELFFHGLDRSEADQMLAEIVAFLQVQVPGERTKVTLTRTQNAVHVVFGSEEWGDRDMQRYIFRLRLFQSVREILAAIDLSPCAVAYDPRNGIQMTHLAGFCLATRTCIADPSIRGSHFYSWQLSQLLLRGFAIILPSLREDIMPGGPALEEGGEEPSPREVIRVRHGGRTRGEEWILGKSLPGQMSVAREEDPDHHRRNFGHAIRRLLLVSSPSQSPGDIGLRAAYSNIHNVCDSSSEDLVILWGKNFQELVEHPRAYGFEQIEEVFLTEDLALSRIRLLYGEDAQDFAVAFFKGDLATQQKLKERAKARIASLLEAAQTAGLTWTSRAHIAASCAHRPLASQWYPEGLYDPIVTGLPRELAPTFRLLRMHHPGFASLPLEVYTFLMRDVIIPTLAAETFFTFLEKTVPVDLIGSVSASETETSEG